MTSEMPRADSARAADAITAAPATQVANPPEKRASESENAKARRPLVRVRGLYYPTDHTPDEVFQAIGKLRKEAQREIDRLLAFLDELDGDADLEPDNDAEDGGDEEPSLGSTATLSQLKWSAGGNVDQFSGLDCEAEHDGREPDVEDEEDDPGEDNADGEPSLGWTTGGLIAWTPILDGEEGSLPVAELDALRSQRRPEHITTRADGSRVAVTYRSNGAICRMMPL